MKADFCAIYTFDIARMIDDSSMLCHYIAPRRLPSRTTLRYMRSRDGTSTSTVNRPLLLQLLKGVLAKVTGSVVENLWSWSDEIARLIGWPNIRIFKRWKQRWDDGLEVAFATIREPDQSRREPKRVRLERSEGQVVGTEEEIFTTRDWELHTLC
jgi:hypothetical protein